ncbi:aminotransferase class III-fold pyridoxal phosphate-dependent enzyme [Marinomonas sp. 2405UD68-3]|uniref:aminotransferase class III-fold pyridoxal phosphate-dependent enzyme n=1 Tax=Marinomonas sp. 2405UD68-3 TaxID=3391835 RepID=UPI0039C8DB80
MSDIISQDVDLSAAILELINSSYYGLPRKVTSIKHTVMILDIGSLTGNQHHRHSSDPLLTNVTRIPYDNYLGDGFDSSVLLEKLLNDPSSRITEPAAIILEIVQDEGGLNSASKKWLQSVETLAKRNGAMLIVDEIQTGCGRTGVFLLFQRLS